MAGPSFCHKPGAPALGVGSQPNLLTARAGSRAQGARVARSHERARHRLGSNPRVHGRRISRLRPLEGIETAALGLFGKLGLQGSLPGAAAAPAGEVEQGHTDARAEAERAFAAANDLIPAVELAKSQATDLQAQAETADRQAHAAEARAEKLLPEAKAALKELRILAADIRGTEEEISASHLECIHLSLLDKWQQEHPQATGFQVVSRHETGISGVKGGILLAYVAAVELEGKRWALMSIACAEANPEGQLAGVELHWGGAAQDGWGWEPPPTGWKSEPVQSHEASNNGQAWRTPFATYVPEFLEQPITVMPAHAATLLMPLEGVVAAGGGIAFVLKRPPGKAPEWLQSSVHRDFYLGCKPVVEHFYLLDNPPSESEDQEDDDDESRAAVAAATAKAATKEAEAAARAAALATEAEEAAAAAARAAEAAALAAKAAAEARAAAEAKAAKQERESREKSLSTATGLTGWIAALWGPKKEQQQQAEAAHATPAAAATAAAAATGDGVQAGGTLAEAVMQEVVKTKKRGRPKKADKGTANKASDTAETMAPLPLLSTWMRHTSSEGRSTEGGTMVQQLKSTVLLLDAALLQAATDAGADSGSDSDTDESSSSPVYADLAARLEALHAKADDIVVSATQLVHDAEECRAFAGEARSEADRLVAAAAHASKFAIELQLGAEEAIKKARRAACRVRGKEEEVSVADLHKVASDFMVRQAESQGLQFVEFDGQGQLGGQEHVPAVPPTITVCRIFECDAQLVSHTALAVDPNTGLHAVIVAVALGERFPSGFLEGSLLHWGCVRHFGAKWRKPPAGWRSEPDRSFEVTRAWETPFSRNPAPGYEERDDIAVHVAVLSLPLETDGSVRGVDYVIKTPQGEWLARAEGEGGRGNFHVDFSAAADAVREAAARSAEREDQERRERRKEQREARARALADRLAAEEAERLARRAALAAEKAGA